MIDMKGCTVVRQATGAELEALTSQGWVLLAILSETGLEQTFEQEAVGVEGTPPVNGSYGCAGMAVAVDVRRERPVHRPVYLLGRDDSSALLAATRKIAELESTYLAWDEKLRTEREAHGVAADELSKTRRAMTRLEQTHTITCEHYKKERERNARLEKDIASIRKAIGEREMQRILAEPVPSNGTAAEPSSGEKT